MAVGEQEPLDLSDEGYQKILRERLLKKMGQYDKGLEFDSATAGQASGAEGQLSRDIILNQALQKSAAQMGTLGGKQASTEATDASTKALLANQQQGLELGQQDAMSRDKLNQYLMGKMLDQEGSLARSKDATNKMTTEARTKEEERKSRERQAALDRANDKAIAEAKIDAKPEKGGTQVPGSVAAELGQFDSAISMADDVMKSYEGKASSTGSGLKSFVPGSDANQYEKERDVAAQSIGSILEGGKLTDSDYARYKAMLPSPTDRNDVATTKIAAIKNLIQQRRKGKIEGLAQTGFDVSGVRRQEPSGFTPAKPDTSGTANASTAPSAEDAKALAWAKANPDNPKSAAILAKLKSKGVQ